MRDVHRGTLTHKPAPQRRLPLIVLDHKKDGIEPRTLPYRERRACLEACSPTMP
ncbi:hypothetical protein ACFV7Q_10985 [Streptomyces sp. NPDC059851]|uniref:hypothetical protein n=1 Tax=Streptomyces sp. NPDC059851 TaxID=3346971 RepID=UPI00365B2943